MICIRISRFACNIFVILLELLIFNLCIYIHLRFYSKSVIAQNTNLTVGIGNPCAGQNKGIELAIFVSTNLKRSENGNVGATLENGSIDTTHVR